MLLSSGGKKKRLLIESAIISRTGSSFFAVCKFYFDTFFVVWHNFEIKYWWICDNPPSIDLFFSLWCHHGPHFSQSFLINDLESDRWHIRSFIGIFEVICVSYTLFPVHIKSTLTSRQSFHSVLVYEKCIDYCLVLMLRYAHCVKHWIQDQLVWWLAPEQLYRSNHSLISRATYRPFRYLILDTLFSQLLP